MITFIEAKLIEDVASSRQFPGLFDELLQTAADSGDVFADLHALRFFAARHDPGAFERWRPKYLRRRVVPAKGAP